MVLQRFLKMFSPVILEPLTTKKVTRFVASRFSLILSLGGVQKVAKNSDKIAKLATLTTTDNYKVKEELLHPIY